MKHQDPLDKSREWWVDGQIDAATETIRDRVSKMTDEELFDEIRDQVNRSRNLIGHDRPLTRAIAEEMARRRSAQRHMEEKGRLLKEKVSKVINKNPDDLQATGDTL